VERQYSIAEARRQLSQVIEEAEAGSEVQLTRRGRPVAVVLSIDDYARLKAPRPSFGLMYREFHARYPEPAPGVGPRYFRTLRDRARGRQVAL
jgi:prevent-host-death family protein